MGTSLFKVSLIFSIGISLFLFSMSAWSDSCVEQFLKKAPAEFLIPPDVTHVSDEIECQKNSLDQRDQTSSDQLEEEFWAPVVATPATLYAAEQSLLPPETPCRDESEPQDKKEVKNNFISDSDTALARYKIVSQLSLHNTLEQFLNEGGQETIDEAKRSDTWSEWDHLTAKIRARAAALKKKARIALDDTRERQRERARGMFPKMAAQVDRVDDFTADTLNALKRHFTSKSTRRERESAGLTGETEMDLEKLLPPAHTKTVSYIRAGIAVTKIIGGAAAIVTDAATCGTAGFAVMLGCSAVVGGAEIAARSLDCPTIDGERIKGRATGAVGHAINMVCVGLDAKDTALAATGHSVVPVASLIPYLGGAYSILNGITELASLFFNDGHEKQHEQLLAWEQLYQKVLKHHLAARRSVFQGLLREKAGPQLSLLSLSLEEKARLHCLCEADQWTKKLEKKSETAFIERFNHLQKIIAARNKTRAAMTAFDQNLQEGLETPEKQALKKSHSQLQQINTGLRLFLEDSYDPKILSTWFPPGAPQTKLQTQLRKAMTTLNELAQKTLESLCPPRMAPAAKLLGTSKSCYHTLIEHEKETGKALNDALQLIIQWKLAEHPHSEEDLPPLPPLLTLRPASPSTPAATPLPTPEEDLPPPPPPLTLRPASPPTRATHRIPHRHRRRTPSPPRSGPQSPR